MRNVKNFNEFLYERFSLRDLKNSIIKPRPKIELEPEVDIHQPINIFLSNTKDVSNPSEKRIVTIVDYDIKEYKYATTLYYDLMMVVEDERGQKNTLRFDIFDRSLYYLTNKIIYNAITDKEGAEIIYKLLKSLVEDMDIEKLYYVDFKDVPYLKSK